MSSPLSTTPSLLILDAPLGTGTTRSASHVRSTGSSMLKRSVCQFRINALHLTPLETALPASRDTILRAEPAFSLSSITPSQLTLDAEPGIGITKCALVAPKAGSSMPTKFAFLSLTNARLTMIVATALLATKDTTLRTEPASSPHSTTPSQLTLAALHGTGTIKCALPAQRTGFSILTRSVCRF